MKPEPINPENVDLKVLADAPLADPLGLNIPLGRRTMKRGPRAVYCDSVDDGQRLKPSELQKRKEEAFSAKLCAVLDYYAKSTVPIERVAEHTNLSVEQATAAMQRRGRLI